MPFSVEFSLNDLWLQKGKIEPDLKATVSVAFRKTFSDSNNTNSNTKLTPKQRFFV